REAKDDRCAPGARGRFPRARWGQLPRGSEVRGRPSHHPCEDFSTGVARAGNPAAEVVVSAVCDGFETAGKCSVFIRDTPCGGLRGFVTIPPCHCGLRRRGDTYGRDEAWDDVR